MHTQIRVAVGCLLAAALAACGTTVPVDQQAAGASSLSGDGLSAGVDGPTASPVEGGLAGSTAGPSVSSPGSVVAGPGSVAVPGSSSRSSAGPVRTGAAAVAGGKPIQVGITYVKDAAAGFNAIGIQGATLGDMRLYAQTVVADVNARGGLAGRKVVPVFFAYDINPGNGSYDEQDSQACAYFTQDNHVEVAIVTFAGSVLNECMHKRGIPQLLDGPGGGFSAATFKRYPSLFCLGCFNLDRRADQQVPALVREKYFSGWDAVNGRPGTTPPKIGVITYDFPGYPESVNGPLTRGLVAAGFPKPQVITVAPHDTYDNLAKMQAQISNAILSFRSAGVTHVIIWDDNGVATLFFMQNAEDQKYRPRYGINSGNNMQTVAKVASRNQLNGAIGIGWDPHFDISDAASPSSKWANSARRACYALMQKGKVSTGTGFNETSAMLYCSTILALKDRWDAMSSPSAAGLPASFEAYGDTMVNPGVPATWLSKTQHDGNSGIYDYLYDSSCSCMAYRGPVHLLKHG